MNAQTALMAGAALCRRYAENLSALPHASDAALECAAMLDEARELVPTISENGDSPCQYLLREFFPD